MNSPPSYVVVIYRLDRELAGQRERERRRNCSHESIRLDGDSGSYMLPVT